MKKSTFVTETELLKVATTDLDGTYSADSADNVSPENVAAFREAKENGVVTGFSTGRQANMALHLTVEAQPDYISGDNGAVILARDEQLGKYVLVHCETISTEKTIAAINKAMELDPSCSVLLSTVTEGENKIFVPERPAADRTDDYSTFYNNVATASLRSERENKFLVHDGDLVTRAGSQLQSVGSVVKVGFDFGPEVSQEDFQTMSNFCQELGFEFLTMKHGKIELTASGIDKGRALETIVALENQHGNSIGQSETCHFGDDVNDFSGFEEAGRGYVVESARAEVRESAPNAEVIGRNDEGGVGVKLLERLHSQPPIAPRKAEHHKSDIAYVAAAMQRKANYGTRSLDREIAATMEASREMSHEM